MEDRGKVKTGIAQLYAEMEGSGSRTLGEHFSKFDPQSDAAIRGRWTHRKMYIGEFNTIWSAQRAHYPGEMTEERRARLFEAIFYQRPLRAQDELIGNCELVPGEKRAPLWHPLSQRFRMLQAVNDLRVVDRAGLERGLNEQERLKLIAALEVEGDITWPAIRKLLGLARTTEFNRERGGEKKLVGDRTGSRLKAVFLDRWDRLVASEQLEAARDLGEGVEEDTLYQKA
ncbi:MAG: hypothetical protein NTY38_28795, partial [Acidobacteria bacterium]|nr:hypothetical protein [Acidobacteriota bacterium]